MPVRPLSSGLLESQSPQEAGWSKLCFFASHRGCMHTGPWSFGASFSLQGLLQPFLPAQVPTSSFLSLPHHPARECLRTSTESGSYRKEGAFSRLPEEQKEPWARTADMSTTSGSVAKPVSLTFSSSSVRNEKDKKSSSHFNPLKDSCKWNNGHRHSTLAIHEHHVGSFWKIQMLRFHLRTINWNNLLVMWASLLAQAVRESICNAGDLGLIPGLGRLPGERNSYPLQYSGLENSMDRGAWWATAHGVTESRTWLSDFHFLVMQCICRGGRCRARERGCSGEAVCGSQGMLATQSVVHGPGCYGFRTRATEIES